MQDEFFPHSKEIADVLEHLKTSAKGLSSEEANKRLQKYGLNQIEDQKISYLKIFFKQFQSILIYVLLIASLISFFAGRWVDFSAIIFMVFINSIIGFWQEIRAEVSIKALKKFTETKDKVIRNGEIKIIPSSELTIGDVVLLSEGSVISADMRLIDSSSLMIDESSLTGESIPTFKDHNIEIDKETMIFDRKNMVFSGSSVTRGTGKGVVVEIGKKTYFSLIAEKVKEKSPTTPLNKALQFFAKYYTFFIIFLLLLIGGVALIQGRDILDIAYILIAELVSAVPEGLPIVVTLVMVIGSVLLSRKKTYVRYLPSVETLGSATVIAADKTGTITFGKISVDSFFTKQEDKLKMIAALCNDAFLGHGDPLDVALIKWHPEIKKINDKFKDSRIWAHSFDSKLRLMATAYEIEGKKIFLIKGAYEEIKEFVKKDQDLKEFEEKVVEYSSQGLRVIALGMGQFTSHDLMENKDIELIGLIGFLDPPKPSVKKAVDISKKANIKVLMITGDYPLTAQAVAEKVGIYNKDDEVITGRELEKLDDNLLEKKLEKTTVFARILPEHKYKIVKILQKNNEIVAAFGDGVNDVPALKKADLGIAMGSGSEVAKSISKMILADNDLKVIIDAIKIGRRIADNIRKVIYYLLSSSIQEIIYISFSIFLNLPLPLFPIQILWINLVTDGVQDKVFPFCKEEKDIMRRKPKNPKKQFFDSFQIFRIAYFGISAGILTLFLYIHLLKIYSYEVVVTISFTSVVFSQWVNGIQSQKESEPFFKNIIDSFLINPYIYYSIGLGILLQLVAIYIFPKIFHCVPLDFSHLKYPILLSISVFFLIEIRKWGEYIFRKIKKRFSYGK